MKVYLDNAATTAIHPDVVEAMIPILKNQFNINWELLDLIKMKCVIFNYSMRKEQKQMYGIKKKINPNLLYFAIFID